MPFPLFSRTGDWMRRHPGVAHSVMWMRWPYPGWAEWRKRALRKAVDRILDEGVYSSPSDPPPNKKKYRNPDEVAQMVLDRAVRGTSTWRTSPMPSRWKSRRSCPGL
jgi:hypothetical protein